jgi:mRNA interferase MazF
MNVRRGDLVLVDLDPTKGDEIQKTRPAVVIQNDVGNEHSTTTIVAPVTSTCRGYPFEVELEAHDEDVEKDSSVLLDQIRTISIEHRVLQKLGRISGAKMREIDEAIKLSLGIDSARASK